jgi:hypothetical protein
VSATAVAAGAVVASTSQADRHQARPFDTRFALLRANGGKTRASATFGSG